MTTRKGKSGKINDNKSFTQLSAKYSTRLSTKSKSSMAAVLSSSMSDEEDNDSLGFQQVVAVQKSSRINNKSIPFNRKINCSTPNNLDTKHSAEDELALAHIYKPKTENLRTLLEKADNRKELRNKEHQQKSLTTFIECLRDQTTGPAMAEGLLQIISRHFNILPPLTDNFYPIFSVIKADGQNRPMVDFYFHSPDSPFHITELMPYLDMETINLSKLIYSYIYEFFHKTRE